MSLHGYARAQKPASNLATACTLATILLACGSFFFMMVSMADYRPSDAPGMGPSRQLSVGELMLQSQGPMEAPPEPDLFKVLPNLRDVDFSLPCNAYYVNMDSAVGRRRVMEDTFGRLWGGQLHRVQGVRGANDTEVLALTGGGPVGRATLEAYEAHRSHRRGELGAIMSHLQAVKMAFLAGDEVAFILEDDIGPYFMPYWTIDVRGIIHTLKDKDWDTVQLGYFPRWDFDKESFRKEPLLGGHLLHNKLQYSLAAYLISRRGMEKVVDRFWSDRTASSTAVPNTDYPTAVDDDGYFRGLLDNYLVHPAMFMPHGKETSITSDSKQAQERLDEHRVFVSELWSHWPPEIQSRYFKDLADRRPE
jgi:hypothetical protein